ncbi:Uncharacterised protein [Mycobacteroides abscessus subsp. abscessus]|nr:Uncharacterised protein [Mycobacteroides abscessus subsp. abscessus]
MPPTKTSSAPMPSTPTPAPAVRVIILRRPSVEVSNASCSSAARVRRSTSGEGPSCRSWMEISAGMNFLRISTTAMPMTSTEMPKVRPTSGVNRE